VQSPLKEQDSPKPQEGQTQGQEVGPGTLQAEARAQEEGERQGAVQEQEAQEEEA